MKADGSDRPAGEALPRTGALGHCTVAVELDSPRCGWGETVHGRVILRGGGPSSGSTA